MFNLKNFITVEVENGRRREWEPRLAPAVSRGAARGAGTAYAVARAARGLLRWREAQTFGRGGASEVRRVGSILEEGAVADGWVGGLGGGRLRGRWVGPALVALLLGEPPVCTKVSREEGVQRWG